MKIAIACGGTGGHLFPGLATADVLKKRGHDVVLWLTGRDVENIPAQEWGGPVVSVPAKGFSSGFSLGSIGVLLSLFSAFLRCRKLMRKNKPDVLLAMGSYASVGPALAARSLCVPLVLHEANVVPGKAISFLSKFASLVAVTFEDTCQYLNKKKVVVTGFPVRTDHLLNSTARFLDSGTFTVLVMGGSQGAHKLNEVVSFTLCRLRKKGVKIQVVHLAGNADGGVVKDRYVKDDVPHEVFGFLKDIARAYNSADIAILRSGAATCAEISICAVPALLVPLPSAQRDHQSANAAILKKAGCSDVLEEKDLTEEWLCEYLESCIVEKKKLERMKEALKEFGFPDSADKLAGHVEDVGQR